MLLLRANGFGPRPVNLYDPRFCVDEFMPTFLVQGSKGHEPYYGVVVAEFEKGILHEDRRMDLCKM